MRMRAASPARAAAATRSISPQDAVAEEPRPDEQLAERRSARDRPVTALKTSATSAAIASSAVNRPRSS